MKEQGFGTHKMKFNGTLLERGFWFYVWHITQGEKEVYYIGRTGDTSSPNAASPFNRLIQHLNTKKNAKSNTLYKQIKKEGLDLVKCEFEMTAVGPVFAEQVDMKLHKPYRDIAMGIEHAIAEYMKEKGYKVLGTHPKKRSCDKTMLEKIIKQLGF